ncbi:MAG: 2-deoxyribose-5-phosphate aldolase, partial [Bacteroidota bacterium]|nr:2-deoxyribose-5-phosphate aldolase [Bacteroidota bacterium]
CLLTNEQIIEVCELAVETHVDYIKTSTGFNGPGASVDNIKLLRANLPDTIKIKASGGINTKELAESLILAGADIIGTSSGSLLL